MSRRHPGKPELTAASQVRDAAEVAGHVAMHLACIGSAEDSARSEGALIASRVLEAIAAQMEQGAHLYNDDSPDGLDHETITRAIEETA